MSRHGGELRIELRTPPQHGEPSGLRFLGSALVIEHLPQAPSWNVAPKQGRLRSRPFPDRKPDGRAAFEPSAVIGSTAEELMVCRLFAGGNRIRTIGPALVKDLSAVVDGRCRTDKLDGVIKHRSSRETTMVGRGPLSTAVSFSAGPMVRIRFPPAVSPHLVRTRPEPVENSFRHHWLSPLITECSMVDQKRKVPAKIVVANAAKISSVPSSPFYMEAAP